MRKTFWLLFFALLFTAGCNSATPITTPTGTLYVLDRFNKSVYVFSDIHNLNGALDPQRTITGSTTQIAEPSSLAADSRRDILYVADGNANAVLAFIPGSTSDGDVGPRRTYPGLTEPGRM